MYIYIYYLILINSVYIKNLAPNTVKKNPLVFVK